MIIQNFGELARSVPRRHALEIINAGVEAVLTKKAMHNFISLDGDVLRIKGNEFDFSRFERIFVVGGGKAGGDMAEAVEEILGDRIEKGVVIDTQERQLEKIEVVKGSHPIPSKTNVGACRRITEIAEGAGENDLVLCLISGGGSALLANPRTSVEDLIKMNESLMTQGTDIYQTNIVRKHMSRIKGGRLSKLAYPATIVALMISDVLGNDLSVIASGPTVKDLSVLEEAKKIIAEYGLHEIPEEDFEETPKDDKWFSKTHNILLLTNEDAVAAMRAKAEELGYETEVMGYELRGEARDFGKELAISIRPGVARIGAGETTVTVTGGGKGGRNQEVAVGAMGNFSGKGVVVSAGTDGIDNNEAAGGIADEESHAEAKKLGLDIQEYLKDNDVFHLLEKMGDLIMTGPTETNVADIFLALGKK